MKRLSGQKNIAVQQIQLCEYSYSTPVGLPSQMMGAI